MSNVDIVSQLEGLNSVITSAQEEIKRLRALVAGQKGEFVEESKPPWLIKAIGYLGEKEIRGPKHNPKIVTFWQKIRLPGIKDDETPWCAAFVGACLELAGFVSTRKGNARSYKNWGRKLSKPCVGAIVVFWRGSRSGWKGHVGYLVGIDGKGRWLILGGNQGNAVSIRAYAAPGQPGSRVLDIRWPKGHMLPTNYVLPVGSAHLTDGNEQ